MAASRSRFWGVDFGFPCGPSAFGHQAWLKTFLHGQDPKRTSTEPPAC
jgi:hypothetical protein